MEYISLAELKLRFEYSEKMYLVYTNEEKKAHLLKLDFAKKSKELAERIEKYQRV